MLITSVGGLKWALGYPSSALVAPMRGQVLPVQAACGQVRTVRACTWRLCGQRGVQIPWISLDFCPV